MEPRAELYQSLEAPDDFTVRRLVLDYLVHGCFDETARAFLRANRDLADLPAAAALLNGGGSVANGTRRNGDVPAPMEVSEDDEGDTEDPDTARDDPMLVEMPGLSVSNGDRSAEPLEGTENGRMCNAPAALRTLEARKQIQRFILFGKIPEALALCQSSFPLVVSTDSGDQQTASRSLETRFNLQCQQFIETVRLGDASEALKFAQKVLRKYPLEAGDEESKYLNKLGEVLSLIAYKDPQTSPVAEFLSQSHREKLADEVNSTILSSFGLPSLSAIERIVRQVTVVQHTLDDESPKDKRASKERTKWQLATFVQEGS